MVLLYILLAILAFGLLILLHELGHYLTARALGVSIKEFSIGMGPKLFGYTSEKTGIEYKICLLPIGGYVAMVGEDEESDDPNALGKKPAWQRLIIMAAGGVTNLLLGFVLVLITVSLISNELGTTTVDSFATLDDGSPVPSYVAGLREGDVIRSVDGRRVRIGAELDYEIMRRGIDTVTLGVGPAGTGKTYLAVAAAVAAFRERSVNRIILTRPAVEAGERLGFLPGDLQNKVDP